MTTSLAPFAADFDDDHDLAPPQQGQSLDWSIDSLDAADRSLARLAVLAQRRAQVEQLAAAARARLDVWLAKQTAGLDYARDLHTAKLAQYAAEHRDEVMRGAKRGAKSRSLPNGMLGWRATGGGLSVVDRDALAAWASATDPTGDLVRVKIEPDLAAIKKWSKEHNTIPPGMVEEPREEKFYAKPAGDALATTEEEP